MRIKFVVLSVLIGCLALLLGLGEGRTQNAGTLPAGRVGAPRPRTPAPKASASPRWIDERFFQLDRNGDGFLTVDEMTDNLRVEKDKWDVNGDSMIDLAEWRAYVKAVIAEQQRRKATNARTVPRRPVRRPAPPVIQRPVWNPRNQSVGRRPRVQARRPPFNEDRPSRLRDLRNRGTSSHTFPSNLPAWFKAYDADGDGQVSLDEWKAREDNIGEFGKYDLNGDGFITITELLRSGQFATNSNTSGPPRVHRLRAELGEFFYFEVTGTTSGGIWGTDVYTSDSLISTAAVHAGLLRAGETGLVKVTILSGQRRHLASSRNGVMSGGFGAFHRSYRIEKVPH